MLLFEYLGTENLWGQSVILIKDNVLIYFQNEFLESVWEIFFGQGIWFVYRVCDFGCWGCWDF